ncbi:MAG: tetratricopeptide repeat protein [Nitrospirae bacterium]|nr:tetratricopeptide repeat protein [Nitrospirota bacterium]
MKASRIFSLFLIVLVGLIAYSNTFNFPFVFDDDANIVDNPLIKKLDNFILPPGGYKGYFPRAVGFFSFALNYYFGGLKVTGYHIVNLIIHIANAILVYFLVILTFKTPYFRSQQSAISDQQSENPPIPPLTKGGKEGFVTNHESRITVFIALFSALLFVSHPVQTQAVTYIVQRLTSLATMFYLLSIVMYIKARLITQRSAVSDQQSVDSRQQLGEESREYAVSRKQSSASYCLLPTACYFFLSLVSAILAMLTKEMSFTLPIVIILYEFTFFRSSLKKKLLFLLPLLLTLIIIPSGIMGIDKPLGEILSDLSERIRVQTEMSRWDYLLTQFRVIVTYMRLLFLPINQNLDYDYPAYHSLFTLPVFLSFLLLLSILGIAVYLMFKTRAISYQMSAINNNPPAAYSLPLNPYFRLAAFGILWFFITLSVESSIIPIVDVIFEHRVYLPSAGAFIAISTVVFIIIERLKVRWRQIGKATVSLFSLIVIVLATATYARNAVWKDKITLWEDVVSKSPKNARANNNLGASYYEKSMPDRAIEYLSIALHLKPDYVDAYNNLGISYYEKGLKDLAKQQFISALGFAPDDAGAFNNLSIVYASEGLYDQAIEYAQRALKLNPDYAEARNSLGVAYGSKEMYNQALEQFSLALRLKPDYFEAQNNLFVVQKKLRPL